MVHGIFLTRYTVIGEAGGDVGEGEGGEDENKIWAGCRCLVVTGRDRKRRRGEHGWVNKTELSSPG